jgi:hypothetical protein
MTQRPNDELTPFFLRLQVLQPLDVLTPGMLSAQTNQTDAVHVDILLEPEA